MTRRLLILAAFLLALAAPAAAKTHRHPRAPVPSAHHHRHHRRHHRPAPALARVPAPQPASCPAGVPTQTLTVVNQAGIAASDLAAVERAVTDQSLQVRAAWGTPCVVFGPGGWVVTMGTDEIVQPDGTVSFRVDGRHFWNGQPSAVVNAGGLAVDVWARGFSHEVVEMLVDPTLTVRWQLPNGLGGQTEVCDPVENSTYTLDGMAVSDFVTPAYFQAGSAGPFDGAGLLTAPLS